MSQLLARVDGKTSLETKSLILHFFFINLEGIPKYISNSAINTFIRINKVERFYSWESMSKCFIEVVVIKTVFKCKVEGFQSNEDTAWDLYRQRIASVCGIADTPYSQTVRAKTLRIANEDKIFDSLKINLSIFVLSLSSKIWWSSGILSRLLVYDWQDGAYSLNSGPSNPSLDKKQWKLTQFLLESLDYIQILKRKIR